jgi:hypothetical protein
MMGNWNSANLNLEKLRAKTGIRRPKLEDDDLDRVLDTKERPISLRETISVPC